MVGNITSTFEVVAVGGHYKSLDETRSVGGIPGRGLCRRARAYIHGRCRFSVPTNPGSCHSCRHWSGSAHGAVDAEGSTTIGGRTFTFDESESTSDAAIDLGGGVNIGLTDSVRLRLAGSYFRVLEEDAGNGVRFAVGIVFPF